jgi:Domain of unknown function (DUF1772)
MTRYTVLSTLVLLLSGWLTGAESASWALLQPVVARLDDTPQIQMQQGMLRTFGRVMPILLPLTSVLIVLTAVVAPNGAPRVLWVVAAVAAVVLIAFTLTVNVPINKRNPDLGRRVSPCGMAGRPAQVAHLPGGAGRAAGGLVLLCAVGATTLA